jgi:hypothetical protein
LSQQGIHHHGLSLARMPAGLHPDAGVRFPSRETGHGYVLLLWSRRLFENDLRKRKSH